MPDAEKDCPCTVEPVQGRCPWCHDRPVIERRDRYTITVDGHPIRATEEQEAALRGMDAAGASRFLTVMGYPIPPEGWLPFGSLIDYDGPAECSDETGEDGLPLWERPTPPDAPRDRAPRNYAEQRALLDDSLRNIPPFEQP